MRMHQYTATWFEVDGGGNSVAKYQAGQNYPITDETRRHQAVGIVVEVEVPDAPAPEVVADVAAETPADTPAAA